MPKPRHTGYGAPQSINHSSTTVVSSGRAEGLEDREKIRIMHNMHEKNSENFAEDRTEKTGTRESKLNFKKEPTNQ